jgi:hypothetical protein
MRATWLVGVSAVLVLSACGGSSTPALGAGSSPAPTSPATQTPTTTAAAALPPAVVPPVPGVSECSVTLQVGADGNAGPLSCPDGGINVLAWNYFAKNHPLVLALTPDASVQQVEAAMCADVRTSTIPIETSTGELAFRYYGWTFVGLSDITTAFPGFCGS